MPCLVNGMPNTLVKTIDSFGLMGKAHIWKFNNPESTYIMQHAVPKPRNKTHFLKPQLITFPMVK